MSKVENIKDLYENDDLSLREIVRRTKHHFTTVQKYAYQTKWDEAVESPLRQREFPVMQAYIWVVDEWLEQDKKEPRKQRHTIKRVYDRLQKEHGYKGSYNSVMADNRTMFGAVAVSQADWKTVSTLAKEGQKSRSTIKNLFDANAAQSKQLAEQKTELKRYGKGLGITASMEFYSAQQRAPHRMAETIADIQRQPPEQTAQERSSPQRKRIADLEL